MIKCNVHHLDEQQTLELHWLYFHHSQKKKDSSKQKLQVWHTPLSLFIMKQPIYISRQSSLSYIPLFSWPAHPYCTQLDPRSRQTFQHGIWHQWKLGLLCYYLQHFVAISITFCSEAQIFDCMNVGVFISPVSSLLKPVIHFRDSVL